MENEFRRFRAPVKVGDEVDIHVEAVGEKGDGIAKYKGFVIFVPGAKEGDDLKVKIEKVFKKFAFATILGEGSPSAQGSEDSSEESDEDSENFDDESEESEESEDFEDEEDSSDEEDE